MKYLFLLYYLINAPQSLADHKIVNKKQVKDIISLSKNNVFEIKNKKSTRKGAEKSMEKFDIQKFKSFAKNDEYNHILKDGSEVNQYQSTDGFTEKITPAKGWFYQYKDFYLNGSLKEKGSYFLHGNFKSGTWLEYDQQGNLLNQINHDTKFKLGIDEVFDLIKDKKIFFSKDNYINKITRTINDEKPYWFVEWKENPGRIEVLKIDDSSGKIVSQGSYDFEDN
jgi:hypothetical protein